MDDQRTSAVILYRDGTLVLREVLDPDRRHLLRAGFRPFRLRLTREDGSSSGGTLWMQDDPSVSDYLNAARYLFLDEPGSLSWG